MSELSPLAVNDLWFAKAQQLERDLAAARAALEAAQAELDKWRKWWPKDYELKVLKAQAGEFISQATTLVYVRALEARLRAVEPVQG